MYSEIRQVLVKIRMYFFFSPVKPTIPVFIDQLLLTKHHYTRNKLFVSQILKTIFLRKCLSYKRGYKPNLY